MSEIPPVLQIGELVFSLCKARKGAECWKCSKAIQVGEQIYRPITNGAQRMQRLHVGCTLAGRAALRSQSNKVSKPL